jgi:hypothetical protein
MAGIRLELYWMNVLQWFLLDDLAAANSVEWYDSFSYKFEGLIQGLILKRAFQLAHPMVLEEVLQED